MLHFGLQFQCIFNNQPLPAVEHCSQIHKQVNHAKFEVKYLQFLNTTTCTFCRLTLQFLQLNNWNIISKYSRVRLRVYAPMTKFTFSTAISKSLELKRSLIALYKAQSNSKKKRSNQNLKNFIHSLSKLVWIKRGFFIRTSFDRLWMKLFKLWLLRFFWIALSFLKSYRTPFLLKGLRNGSRKREPGHPGVNFQMHTTVFASLTMPLLKK